MICGECIMICGDEVTARSSILDNILPFSFQEENNFNWIISSLRKLGHMLSTMYYIYVAMGFTGCLKKYVVAN